MNSDRLMRCGEKSFFYLKTGGLGLGAVGGGLGGNRRSGILCSFDRNKEQTLAQSAGSEAHRSANVAGGPKLVVLWRC